MRSDERNWETMRSMLAAESAGKSPRLFSSRKTLFGIPSALDQELEELAKQPASNDAAKAAVSGAPAGKSAPAGKAPKPTRVVHTIAPVFDGSSRVLILGTMPSPKSRESGFYYGHPQNRFWRVMAALFDEPLPQTNAEKEALALRHGVALWDVLAECTIEGAADGTIAECVPNNIASVLARAPIEKVFCTGAKATELYRKYCEPHTDVPCTRLPSTSPANAATSLEQLIEAYRQLVPFCR